MENDINTRINAFYALRDGRLPAGKMDVTSEDGTASLDIYTMLTINHADQSNLVGLFQAYNVENILWQEYISIDTDKELVPKENYIGNSGSFGTAIILKTQNIALPDDSSVYLRFDLFSGNKLLDSKMSSFYSVNKHINSNL